MAKGKNDVYAAGITMMHMGKCEEKVHYSKDMCQASRYVTIRDSEFVDSNSLAHADSIEAHLRDNCDVFQRTMNG